MTSVHRPEDLRLHWHRPAAHWYEGAPVGNGRLAAMVLGGTAHSRFPLNDSTVWSGTPDQPARALHEALTRGAGPARLEQARAALRAGDHRTAERLLMSFEGPYSQEYLPYADLEMELGGGEAGRYLGRTLNLDNGVVEEQLDVDDTRIQRLTWASAPADALCLAVAADRPTTMRLRLSTRLRTTGLTAGPDGIVLGVELPVDGAPLHEPQAPPLRWSDTPVDGYDPFAALALRLDTDGSVTSQGGRLTVVGLTRAQLTLASSTSPGDHWARTHKRSRPRHRERAATTATAALCQGTDVLLRTHDADMRAQLGTTDLRIGARRGGLVDVEQLLDGKDEQLMATVLFQFGRHLLASASRPHAGPPANLQGIWNADLRPAWSSNYTININTQMNYWGADAVGLSPCQEPLFDLLDRLAEQGTAVARDLYGTRGWVAHHNTDPWGWAMPVGMGHGHPSWALWMTGGTWLVQHVWDHWEFSQDTVFLRERALPLLYGAALFCLDWLVEEEDGRLGTLPSTSPENLFRTASGASEALGASTAIDLALIRATLERTLTAARLTGTELPEGQRLRRALDRLRPLRTTARGLLQEWGEDVPEADPHHRHLSPLVAVHPLGQITPRRTPELARAAAKLMDSRGPGAMGWSWAWKITLRARLGDGETGHALFKEAVRPLRTDPDTAAPVDGSQWGGLLPNLLSSHPPFQIDGNWGLMTALAEMVLQSHDDAVHLLPALPAAWPTGAAHGLRCRGGISADLTWDEGRLASLTLRRLAGDPRAHVRLRHRGDHRIVTLAPGRELVLDGRLRPLTDQDTAC